MFRNPSGDALWKLVTFRFTCFASAKALVGPQVLFWNLKNGVLDRTVHGLGSVTGHVYIVKQNAKIVTVPLAVGQHSFGACFVHITANQLAG